MSDDVFPWTPGYGTEVSDNYKVRKAQLGDGYIVIAPQGVNPSSETWPLLFDNIKKTDADEIRDFLRAHIGQTFLWETPDGVVKRFRCEEGARFRYVSAKFGTLNCTFIESFQP